MSDYTVTFDGAGKDALASGNASKVAKGADLDTEFDNIATAILTKYDSSDLASQAQAEAESSNTVLMTPGRVANWADYNAGMVGDIQALVDPNADVLLGWDDSAGAAIGFTLGTGLAFSTTTVGLSHLGIESLTDPNADRVLFWDDSAGATAWLTMGNGLSISTTTLAWSASGISGHDTFTDFVGNEHIDHTAVTLTAGAGLSGGGDISANRSFALDITEFTNIEADGLAAADEFLIYDADGAAHKVLEYQKMGMITQLAQTTQSLAAADANTILEFNGTATVTIPVDATHTWPPGASCLICVDHATQQVTVTAAATVVLNSIFHPGGTAAASDTVQAGGTAALIYLGSDEWYLVGDILT